MSNKILGLKVDILNRAECINRVVSWINEKPSSNTKIVVTAYSEFFVKAQSDKEFKTVLNEADLVTPDGISVLAAEHYLKNSKNKSILMKLLIGFGTGLDVLAGSLGDTVSGVFLFEELCKLAGKNHWKVFLLGSWDNTAERTATMLLKRFPGIIVSWDPGEKFVGTDKMKNDEVINKINDFVPDILCVTYSPVKQEKWIYKNRNILKSKVAIGLGGTFNEFLGDFKKSPQWMEKMGLKWLWRLLQEPKRFGRIVKAVFVFPLLVFKESLR